MKNKPSTTALLINPPTGKYIRGEDRCQVPVEDLTATVSRMPLDLAYIAAGLVKEGFRTYIRDYPAEEKDVTDFYFDLLTLKPDLLLVSATMFTLYSDLSFLKLAKINLPELQTIIKGVSAQHWKEQLLSTHPEVDMVLSGEYELTIPWLNKDISWNKIPGLSYRLGNEIYLSENEPIISDLDSLPFPARSLLNNKLYIRPDTGEPMTTIQTSRGCPYQCIYCLASIVSGNKVRYRSPANIVDEIEICVREHHISNFFFRADTFTLNKKWINEIMTELNKRQLKINYVTNSRVDTINEELIQLLKASGCFLVSLGIESGCEKSLELMKKGTTLNQGIEAVRLLKKYGIKTYLFFMIGFPWEKKEDIDSTIKYSLVLDGDFVEFHIPVPFEKTQLREMMEKENLFVNNDSLPSSSFVSSHAIPAMATKFLSTDELLRMRKKAIIKFYLRPKYILSTLFKSRSLKEIINYVKYGYRRIIMLLVK